MHRGSSASTNSGVRPAQHRKVPSTCEKDVRQGTCGRLCANGSPSNAAKKVSKPLGGGNLSAQIEVSIPCKGRLQCQVGISDLVDSSLSQTDLPRFAMRIFKSSSPQVVPWTTSRVDIPVSEICPWDRFIGSLIATSDGLQPKVMASNLFHRKPIYIESQLLHCFLSKTRRSWQVL